MNHAVLERIKAAGINPAALLSLDNIGAMEVGPSLTPARPLLDAARLGKITGSRFGDVKYSRKDDDWADGAKYHKALYRYSIVIGLVMFFAMGYVMFSHEIHQLFK